MSAAGLTSASNTLVRADAPTWKWKQRLILGTVRWVVPGMARLLGWTWRWEIPDGVPPGAFEQPPRAAVYVFWHRCLLPIAWYARGRGFGVLISQHFDGEVIAQVAERLGYRAFRGSSTRGGKDALQAMTEALGAGHAVALTVDGPRGPCFQAKGGAIQLAKATGAPIYALHVTPQQAWTMRSWDRLQIPKPWTRLRGVWTGPMWVPGECGPEQLEALRLEMEATLNQLRERNDTMITAAAAAGKKEEQCN